MNTVLDMGVTPSKCIQTTQQQWECNIDVSEGDTLEDPMLSRIYNVSPCGKHFCVSPSTVFSGCRPCKRTTALSEKSTTVMIPYLRSDPFRVPVGETLYLHIQDVRAKGAVSHHNS